MPVNIEKLKKICVMALRGSENEREIAKKILKKHGISNPKLFLAPKTKPTRITHRTSRPPEKSKTIEEAIDSFAAEMENMALGALEGALSHIADKFRGII